jgi:hypothetical protein
LASYQRSYFRSVKRLPLNDRLEKRTLAPYPSQVACIISTDSASGKSKFFNFWTKAMCDAAFHSLVVAGKIPSLDGRQNKEQEISKVLDFIG